jgi:hypothetical protein
MLVTVSCPRADCKAQTPIDPRQLDHEIACPQCGKAFVPRQALSTAPLTLPDAGGTLSLPPATRPAEAPLTAGDAPGTLTSAGSGTLDLPTPTSGGSRAGRADRASHQGRDRGRRRAAAAGFVVGHPGADAAGSAGPPRAGTADLLLGHGRSSSAASQRRRAGPGTIV